MKLKIELVLPDSYESEQEISMQINTENNQVHLMGIQGNPSFCMPEPPDFFQDFMQEIIREKTLNENLRTAEAYQSALNSLNKFTNGCMIPITQIDGDFIERYEVFLKKQQVCMNTISFYMRILKAVYNRAIYKKLATDKKPFNNVYTGIAKTRKRGLDVDLIRQIKNLIPIDKDEQLARDLFLFSFYTRGMSFIDMAFLKRSDVRQGELRYRRRKTGQVITVKWEKPMQEIVDAYYPYNDIYLLPIIKRVGKKERSQYRYTQYVVNNSLKAMGQRLMLPFGLTMYVARHSWACVAKSADVPLGVISDAMGHSSEKMTSIYLKSIDERRIHYENERIIHLLQ